ncbi:MAG: hypothetical protein GYA60_04510 [Candidatus Methanofastidiosa archaeon]|nr:hypothetical protein [Candidatus Methanofastidiosa archaeon]
MTKKVQYLDNETGEVFFGKTVGVGKRFDPEKGYLFRNQAGGFSQFYDIPFPTDMSDIEIGRMTRLAKQMIERTNMLGYRGNGGIRPHTPQTIAKILNVEERQAYNFIKKMIDLGIMAKVKVESKFQTDIQYYVNPLYYASSNRIPLNLYLLFRLQLDDYIPSWARKLFLEQIEKK